MCRECLEALGDDVHQLGDGGEIPVDVAHLDVAHVGGQSGHLGVTSTPSACQVDASHDHAMAQIVHPGGTGATIGGPTQPPAYHAEGVKGDAVADSFAVLGAEEGLCRAWSTIAISRSTTNSPSGSNALGWRGTNRVRPLCRPAL